MSCTICFDDDERVYSFSKLNCNHEFHSKCLNEWIEQFPLSFATCPICRRYIPVPISTLIYYTLLDRYNLLKKYIFPKQGLIGISFFVLVLPLIISSLVISTFAFVNTTVNPIQSITFSAYNDFGCPSGIILKRYNGYECG